MRTFLILIPVVLLSCGCITSGDKSQFTKNIRDLGYWPIWPPRGADGVGTIVQFKRKFTGLDEVILTRTEECFPSLQVTKANLGTPTREYRLSKANSVELNALQQFNSQVNLSAVASNASVAVVKLKLKEPFYQAVSIKSAQDKILRKDCAQQLKNRRAILYWNVLGCKGIEYTFFSTDGSQVRLTADYLKQITANPELQRRFEGKSIIETDETLFVGYKPYEVYLLSGMTDNRAEFQEIPLKDFENYLRSVSKGNE